MSVPSFEAVISSLERHAVDYVLVGGLAVNLHGHQRLTADLDFVVRLERPNVKKLADSMREINFLPRVPLDPLQLAEPDVRRQWADEKGMVVFAFASTDPPFMLADIFLEYPIDYNELAAQSSLMRYGSQQVRVCSLEHLLKIKEAAGRPKDLLDVENLRAANAKRNT